MHAREPGHPATIEERYELVLAELGFGLFRGVTNGPPSAVFHTQEAADRHPTKMEAVAPTHQPYIMPYGQWVEWGRPITIQVTVTAEWKP